jgi:xanthine dehydrogenase accessory factor
VTTPIGLPELTGKDPATIAVGVAATLLLAFEREPAAHAEPEPIADAEPEPIDERR